MVNKTIVIRKVAKNTTPVRAKVQPKKPAEMDDLIKTPPIKNNRLAAEFVKVNECDTPGRYICQHCKHFKRDHKAPIIDRQKIFQRTSSQSLERIINSNLIQSPYLKEHLFKKFTSPYDENGRKLFISNLIKMPMKNLPAFGKAPKKTKRTKATGKTLTELAISVETGTSQTVSTSENKFKSNLKKNTICKTRTLRKRWKYHSKCNQTQTLNLID